MMKCIILSFFLCASAIRLNQVPEEVADQSCDPRIKSIFQKHAVNNTVVFTGIELGDNGEYDEMIQNYACGVRRAGLPLLVWSMSAKTHAKLAELGIPDMYVDEKHGENAEFIVPMGQEYKSIVNTKPKQIKAVVDCGFNALWLDSDLGIAQNPLPYFEAHQGDLQVTTNYPQDSMNTGVVYVRNTPGTKVLMDKWFIKSKENAAFPECRPYCTDQDSLSHTIKRECKFKVQSKDFYTEARETNVVKCSFLEENLKIDLLPPGQFADSESPSFAEEWYTFHPIFTGMRSDHMKKKIDGLKSHSFRGNPMWCFKK